jgi:GT2 family glycosyltransferase
MNAMSHSADNRLDPSSPESTPMVSVILPTYNAAAYLGKAIKSILTQHYRHFELIIVNDGSTDETQGLLTQYQDPRIIVINQANLGLPKALNQGIGIAKGKYIARQDADDISLPERLLEQVTFMEQNPSCALLGTWSHIKTASGSEESDSIPSSRQHQHPASNGQLQVLLLINNQFVHSSVMIRASCLNSIGLYSENPEHYPPEDYDLWLRIAKQHRIANLPRVLIEYLELPTSISRTKEHLIEERAKKMSLNAITALCNDARLNTQPFTQPFAQSFAKPDTICALIDCANGRPSAITFTQYWQLQSLISGIAQQIALRFPHEKDEIQKAIGFLRKQTLKALIKSKLLRNFVRHP